MKMTQDPIVKDIKQITAAMLEGASVLLSPTVVRVIEQFAAAMRADDSIENDGIDRLEKLLRKGAVPKPEEINAALFDPPPDGAT